MRVSIIAVGKIKAGPTAALIEDYHKRIVGLGRSLGVTGFSIVEIDTPRAEGTAKRAKEAALLEAAIPDGALQIVLDERGAALTSRQFASKFEAWRSGSVRDLAFLIGGADGHSQAILDSAQERLAFGPATWPHMLVRVMLVEQVYRAMTIIANHPYHRA